MNRTWSFFASLAMVMMTAPPALAATSADDTLRMAWVDSGKIRKGLDEYRRLLEEARLAMRQVAADTGTETPAAGGDDWKAGLKQGYSDVFDAIRHLSETYRDAQIEAPYTGTMVQLWDEMGKHLDQFLNAQKTSSAKAQLRSLESTLLSLEMAHKDHRRWLGTQTPAPADSDRPGGRAMVAGSAPEGVGGQVGPGPAGSDPDEESRTPAMGSGEMSPDRSGAGGSAQVRVVAVGADDDVLMLGDGRRRWSLPDGEYHHQEGKGGFVIKNGKAVQNLVAVPPAPGPGEEPAAGKVSGNRKYQRVSVARVEIIGKGVVRIRDVEGNRLVLPDGRYDNGTGGWIEFRSGIPTEAGGLISVPAPARSD